MKIFKISKDSHRNSYNKLWVSIDKFLAAAPSCPEVIACLSWHTPHWGSENSEGVTKNPLTRDARELELAFELDEKNEVINCFAINFQFVVTKSEKVAEVAVEGQPYVKAHSKEVSREIVVEPKLFLGTMEYFGKELLGA